MDVQTNVSSTISWLASIKMLGRSNKCSEYSPMTYLYENVWTSEQICWILYFGKLNKNVRTNKHFASSVQYFASEVDKLLVRPNKKWFQNHENETVDPETVFKTEKMGLLFLKYGLWIGIDGKIPFYFGRAYIYFE